MRGRCARVAAVVVCPGVSSIQLEAVHREVFVVHSYDLDWSEQLAVRALSSFLQEAARMHSEHLGVGITWLMERGLAWAVHRIKLEVLAAARLREALTVETWASGYDRLNAYRDFEVRGEGGRPIARASSAWVVFDALQRRAVKLPQEWIASGVPMPDRPRALELPKKKPPELSAPTTERPEHAARVAHNKTTSVGARRRNVKQSTIGFFALSPRERAYEGSFAARTADATALHHNAERSPRSM